MAALDPRSLRPGTVIGNRYRLGEVIGQGGMGVVYAAQHVELGRRCALKLLLPQFSRDRVWVERFRREARSASSIGHENIIDITDVGVAEDGSFYYVMELLDGEPLSVTLVRDGTLPWERVQNIAVQLCDALAAAHHLGIVHRDLKPANIFRSPRSYSLDFVKILDFGIARSIGEGGEARLTAIGEVFGTPGYMAPEQFCGGVIDARTDVYALAVVLYQLLGGKLPFSAQSPHALAHLQFTSTPASLRGVVPPRVDAALQAALAAVPDQRPANMTSFAAALGLARTRAPGAESTGHPRVPNPSTDHRASGDAARQHTRHDVDGRRWRTPIYVATATLLLVANVSLFRWLGAEPSGGGEAEAVAEAAARSSVEPSAAVDVDRAGPAEAVRLPSTPIDAQPAPEVKSMPAPPPGSARSGSSEPGIRSRRRVAAQSAKPEALETRLDRIWRAATSCLCDYWEGYPPHSLKLRVTLDAQSEILAVELANGATGAQSCLTSAVGSRPTAIFWEAVMFARSLDCSGPSEGSRSSLQRR